MLIEDLVIPKKQNLLTGSFFNKIAKKNAKYYENHVIFMVKRIAVALLVLVLVSSFCLAGAGQNQPVERGFVKISMADILPTRSLQTVVVADVGYVFGYDPVGYLKKMAIEDIPMITSFQKGALLNKEALQSIWARDSGYAIGYDGYGNLVKLPISVIPDDNWRAFGKGEIGIGSGYVFAVDTSGPFLNISYGFIKISIFDIPTSRSLDIVFGADSGYIIGFEKGWAGNDLRKISMSIVPEALLSQLSTTIAADNGYVIGLDDRGRLMRVPLSELDLGYASSLANRIIAADSGFVICRVIS